MNDGSDMSNGEWPARSNRSNTSPQSALANVRLHAAASRVVTLSYLSDLVTLDVVDDGVGFDPAGFDPAGIPDQAGTDASKRSPSIWAISARASVPDSTTSTMVREVWMWPRADR